MKKIAAFLVSLGLCSGAAMAQDATGIVITSYSIHYTKLYEDDLWRDARLVRRDACRRLVLQQLGQCRSNLVHLGANGRFGVAANRQVVLIGTDRGGGIADERREASLQTQVRG